MAFNTLHGKCFMIIWRKTHTAEFYDIQANAPYRYAGLSSVCDFSRLVCR